MPPPRTFIPVTHEITARSMVFSTATRLALTPRTAILPLSLSEAQRSRLTATIAQLKARAQLRPREARELAATITSLERWLAEG